MPVKCYRGALPKPDSQGRWRPAVGRLSTGRPQRFYVGNKRDTTKAKAQRRLDYIRDLFDRQCAELGIDFWANWTLVPPEKLVRGERAVPMRGDEARTIRYEGLLQRPG